MCFGDNAELYSIVNFELLALVLFMMTKLISFKSLNKKIFTFAHFFLFSFISCIWSYVPSDSIIRTQTMWKLWIMFIITVSYLIKTRNSLIFADGIAVSSIFVAIYILNSYGISGLRLLMIESVRLGSENMNSNTVATFLAISSSFFFLKILHKKSLFNTIVLIVFIIIIALTGSKKGLIDLALGFVLGITFYSGNTHTKFLRVLLSFSILILLFLLFKDIPLFQLGMTRFEGLLGLSLSGIDSSTMERYKLIEAGFKQFLENPILGIGLGASGYITTNTVGYNTYLHSNPIELLATLGIIGFLLFYVPFIKLIITCYKKISIDQKGLFIFILLCIEMVNSMFSVIYFSKLFYMELAVAIAYCVNCKENIKNKRRVLNQSSGDA